MPGSNAYPLASIMFRTRGSELLEPDAADVGFGGSGTARSGVDEASTFRLSSARWRTPRETVDNRDYKAILSETRKRVDSKPPPRRRGAPTRRRCTLRGLTGRDEQSLPPRRDRGRRGLLCAAPAGIRHRVIILFVQSQQKTEGAHTPATGGSARGTLGRARGSSPCPGLDNGYRFHSLHDSRPPTGEKAEIHQSPHPRL